MLASRFFSITFIIGLFSCQNPQNLSHDDFRNVNVNQYGATGVCWNINMKGTSVISGFAIVHKVKRNTNVLEVFSTSCNLSDDRYNELELRFWIGVGQFEPPRKFAPLLGDNVQSNQEFHLISNPERVVKFVANGSFVDRPRSDKFDLTIDEVLSVEQVDCDDQMKKFDACRIFRSSQSRQLR